MPDQQGNIPKGGTMRLGKYPCTITPGTKMAECYGTTEIDERHRHRYEFNNEFRAEFEEKGLVIAGTSPDGRLVEAVEIPGRDFHLGAQFHPEFKSRPNRAHPLFKGFIAAALKSSGRACWPTCPCKTWTGWSRTCCPGANFPCWVPTAAPAKASGRRS